MKQSIGQAPLKYADDLDAQQELARIKHEIETSHRVESTALDTLSSLHSRHPDAPEVTSALVSAYQMRQDWYALDAFYEHSPEATRDYEAWTNALLESGQYGKAIALLEPILADAPDHWNLLCMLAKAYYYSGNTPAAMQACETVIAHASGAPLGAALQIRGLAAIQLEDWALAEQSLLQTIKLDDKNIVAMTALARVMHRQGQPEAARQWEIRALETRNKESVAEEIAMRMAALAPALEEAWHDSDYSRCRQIIEQMKPYADPALMQTLQQYESALKSRGF